MLLADAKSNFSSSETLCLLIEPYALYLILYIHLQPMGVLLDGKSIIVQVLVEIKASNLWFMEIFQHSCLEA